MRLRKADCGHWVPETLPATGIDVETNREVHLCPSCRVEMLQHASMLHPDIKQLVTEK